MRVLLLNLYYPPDTSATAKVAAAFVEPLAAKHEVTVLCGRPSYDPTERRPWRPWQVEQCGNVKIIRVGSTDYPRTQMTKRIINYLSYVGLCVPRALFVKCDVVVAMTDPPFQGITGAFVALLKRKAYVYDIFDLYPDMALGGSIVAPGLLARVWDKMHRWALRRAKRVIVLGEDMRARIVAKGLPAERVAVVRSGAEVVSGEASEASVDPEIVRQIRGDFRFILLHAGNLGFYGAWSTLVAAARELSEDGVGLVFVGDGAQRAQIEIDAGHSRNVRFLPFFPVGKIPSVLASADAHVITIKRGLEGVVVPSKMYSILAAGRPVVAVAPGEADAASLAVRHGYGVAVDPDKPAELVVAVRRLLAEPALLTKMRSAARAAAYEYDRVTEIQKFVRIVEEVGLA